MSEGLLSSSGAPLPPVWQRVPVWMWLGTALVITLTVAVLASGDDGPLWLDPLTSGAKLALEASALLWGASRADLPARARLALRILGSTSAVSAVLSVAVIAFLLRNPIRVPWIYNGSWLLVSYLLATTALFLFPQRPAARGENTTVVLDLLIASVGVGALAWSALGASRDESPASMTVLTVVSYALSTIGILSAVTFVTVRGRMVSSRRAFWWFIAGQALYVPITLLSEVSALMPALERAIGAAYDLGALPTALGMVLLRTDPYQQESSAPPTNWMMQFNPFVVLVPAALGVTMFVTAVRGRTSDNVLMTGALVIVTTLLSIRLMRSSRENMRLLTIEAERERHVRLEVTSAMTRLAGGIAHEFNNLMTTVIGNADMGAARLQGVAPVDDEFTEIRRAGERAAALTRQMLQFSGRHRPHMEALDVSDACADALAAVLRHPGAVPHVAMTSGLVIKGDRAQLVQLLEELISNARWATASGGTIRITIDRVDLHAPLETPFLSVSEGSYVLLEVTDTGSGIAPEVLPRIFDPFFSTQPRHTAPGLGLAAAYGIVAAHRGGVAVTSTPAVGTTVRVYLPLLPSVGDRRPTQ